MPLGKLLIDPHRLAVLREVARAGSFAGAAAALRHTPSAVSQQIAALERGAGIMLVERSTRGVTLTDAGRALLATADAIHAELQLAAQRLRALAADGPQALTVVTFPSAGEPLLAPALTAMTAAADSQVEITVIEAESDEALGAVRDGRADLALLYHFHTARPPRAWPAAAGPGTYIPLVAEPLRLLVPAGHPLAGQPAASLAEVADDRWIHGWGEVGDVTDMLAALSGFRPQVACRSSDYRFMSALVGAGVGVALVPRLALTGSPRVRDLPITPSPPATSAPGSPGGTSQTRPQSGWPPHCALAPSALWTRLLADSLDSWLVPVIGACAGWRLAVSASGPGLGQRGRQL